VVCGVVVVAALDSYRCILLLLLLLLTSLSSTTYNCFNVEDLSPRSVGDGFLALHEENHHVFGFWLFQEICFITVFNVGSRALF
jgi:uncharacterized membrane protein YhhN